MSAPHTIAKAPDGNGGVYMSLQSAGVLDALREQGELLTRHSSVLKPSLLPRAALHALRELYCESGRSLAMALGWC
jgi:hypothetical protein